MKYVMFYEAVDDFRDKAMANFAEHQAWFMTFAERGELLLIGPFSDGSGDAMAVFTTQEAAEAFIAGDPFVREGIVRTHRIREWNEALSPS